MSKTNAFTTIESVYTVREIAEAEKLHPQTVSAACARGEFPGAYRTGEVGGVWRIPESAVVQYRLAKARQSVPVPDYQVAPFRPKSRVMTQVKMRSQLLRRIS